jgi:hypothetical protein
MMNFAIVDLKPVPRHSFLKCRAYLIITHKFTLPDDQLTVSDVLLFCVLRVLPAVHN